MADKVNVSRKVRPLAMFLTQLLSRKDILILQSSKLKTAKCHKQRPLVSLYKSCRRKHPSLDLKAFAILRKLMRRLLQATFFFISIIIEGWITKTLTLTTASPVTSNVHSNTDPSLFQFKGTLKEG